MLGSRVALTARIYTPLDRGMVLLKLFRWKFSHKETLQQTYIRLNFNFIHKNDKFAFLSHPLKDLGCNVQLCLQLVGTRVVDFLFATSNIFRQLLQLRRYKQILVEVGVFQRGRVTLSENFRQKGTSPTNLFWYQTSTLIALSCTQYRQYAVSFSSQSTRATGRRRDGQTDTEL